MRPRRPKHPPLVPLVIAGSAASLVLVVLSGLGVGDDGLVRVWWIVAIAAAGVAVVAALTGAADLAALQPRSRAARSASVHAAVQIVATALLVLAAVLGAVADADGAVSVAQVVSSALAFAVLLVGGVLGAVAAHVYGAGLREETLKPTVAGSTSPVIPEEA